MTEALRNFFQSVGDLLSGGARAPEPPQQVGGYVVDYSPLSDADIAAAAPCAEILQQNDWTSINRKS